MIGAPQTETMGFFYDDWYIIDTNHPDCPIKYSGRKRDVMEYMENSNRDKSGWMLYNVDEINWDEYPD